jgi:hypothetical protein
MKQIRQQDAVYVVDKHQLLQRHNYITLDMHDTEVTDTVARRCLQLIDKRLNQKHSLMWAMPRCAFQVTAGQAM